ncbi:hypothetical protein FBZ94_11452 [Bradyrhizobium sacchari]|uniref:Uncharacterized protein n=1 Tax=Bradyrhizobium sacchari TaxID=1399419 RepID=A0A560HTA8_9BRAD|nr:hypothetical protein FBZ94_11452 [Bradyrhizobium sacchari]TWB67930.1 hypothetical protein FBZ95_11352 [Bradyrhizobium sacchari]
MRGPLPPIMPTSFNADIWTLVYPKPGDALALLQPVLFQVSSRHDPNR